MQRKILFPIVFILLIVFAFFYFVRSAPVNQPVRWTAPPEYGLDSVITSAWMYDLRYSRDSAAFVQNPLTGTQVPTLKPKAPGQIETYSIPNLRSFSRYFAAVRARDSSGNWAEWSNIHRFITNDIDAPGRVVDLSS